VENILGLGNIYEEGGIRYVHHLEQALRAQALFKLDRDYVVKDGQVVIVDEFTGRLMPGRRYSQGLHQALEAKEKAAVQAESRTLATITFQNYFRLYKKLAGMTGTAVTSAEEFHKVYGLEAVVIPTNKSMIRQDLSDRIYKGEKGKFQAVVKEIKDRHKKGQPVLTGTVSIEKNELLSALLKKEGVPHEVLNAKNHEREAQIIAEAGKKGAVTVATNMAGRGVDIMLGGVPPSKFKVNGEDFNERNFRDWEKERDEVVAAGGLFVLGTERHEARRIDNQLRGRSGRQGDPGSSQFFVSLEDDLMRIFGGDRIKNLMERLKVPEGQPIENKMISKAIESAQAKIEGFNFDARKHVLEYDDVVNKQREVIYKRRKEVLKSENLKPKILEAIKDEIKKIVEFHTEGYADNWNYKEISEVIKSIFPTKIDDLEKTLRDFQNSEEMSDYLINLAEETYQEKEKEISDLAGEATGGEKNMRQIEKFVMLRNIDVLWMEHLDNLEHLRDSVRLRAYGQKDPLVEYKNEGHRLFQKLLAAIQSGLVNTIYKVSLAPASENNVILRARPEESRGKISRNSPCPCGSGKKYKRCHGQ
jgi:preprotein translocase subunit SecA